MHCNHAIYMFVNVVVGGESEVIKFRDDILRFNPETGSWDDTGKKLTVPTAHHAVTSIDNCPSKFTDK